MKNLSADILESPRPLSRTIRLLQSSPLRHETFRWLWLAGVGSFLGTWMHNVAARWIAATVSSSPMAVSTVDTLQVLPVVLLSLGAGALADSIDRRRLLVITHASLTLITLAMGVLASFRLLSLPALLALTALIGTLGALNGPAWQATVPRQVPEDEVTGAVALISTGFNIARTIGPTIGAWMLISFGAAIPFYLNAGSYLLIGALIWRLPPQPPKAREGSVVSPLSDPSLCRFYVVIFLFGLCAMPSLSLLPVIARDDLHGNALTYGTLLSAFGVGAICFGPFIAAVARKLGYRLFVFLTCLTSAIGLGLLIFARTVPVAMLGAAMCGVGWIGTISTTNAAVNTRSRDEARGRALAFYLTFAIGGQAAGSFIGGWMAQQFGLVKVMSTCMFLLVLLAVGALKLSVKTVQASFLITLVLFCASAGNAQQPSGSLRGRIVDQLGGLIVGAQIELTDASGSKKSSTTDNGGNYLLTDLVPGVYTVRASASGFEPYEESNLKVSSGHTLLNITLNVAHLEQVVTTTTKPTLNTDPENNAGAIIIHSAELDALPDNPEELQSALQALAGPSAGPDGGQIFVDGFSSGHVPTKQSIREVRINQNPFSAEFDKIGLGRIEILTKPGGDSFHGQGSFIFSDESLNSRNPFTIKRAPFQDRNYSFSLGGPIILKKASFFVDIGHRNTDGNSVINATILDSGLNVTTFNSVVRTPQRRTNLAARLDYQLNKTNTLVGRYALVDTAYKNDGLSDLTLPSVANANNVREHTFQLSNNAVLNRKTLNETRFQYVLRRSEDVGDNSTATINVLGAFIGGGAPMGISSIDDHRWELQNNVLWASGNHTLKIGGRLRGLRVADVSSLDFGGTFVFGAGLAPELDANNQVVVNGRLVPITSIERYRRTLLFQQRGLNPQEIRLLGGGATQFSRAGGNPLTKVTQIDFGSYIQDDWRLRPDFLLSLGLRYETQTNVHDSTDFAPRVSFAWAPHSNGNRTPKTIIRGGFGIFFDRISETLRVQADRFGGNNQLRFVIDNPDFFPSTPPIETLVLSQAPEATVRVSESLRTPYALQSAMSIERQLPGKLTVSVSFIHTRMDHVLRSRNLNAPLITISNTTGLDRAERPLQDLNNIFGYESSGLFDQKQILINVKNQVNQHFSFFATYNLSKANSDTDGADTFPANSYNLHGEYGRSALDTRHRFVFVGVIDLPHGFSLNPFIVVRSGLPFNITLGRDINGDSLFTERPALTTNSSNPGTVSTPFGLFDVNPTPGAQTIPRNFGEGPNFVAVNLRVSKSFGFGKSPESALSKPQSAKKKPGDQADRTLNIYGNVANRQPYQLTVSVQARNIFNRTNVGLPIGDLSSPLFGLSNSLAPSSGFGISGDSVIANRRIEAQVRFTF